MHRYHRPAALIASSDAKDRNQALRAMMDWLQPQPVPDDGMSAADRATFNAFFSMMGEDKARKK